MPTLKKRKYKILYLYKNTSDKKIIIPKIEYKLNCFNNQDNNFISFFIL